jgi:hypothetical protein
MKPVVAEEVSCCSSLSFVQKEVRSLVRTEPHGCADLHRGKLAPAICGKHDCESTRLLQRHAQHESLLYLLV